MEKKEWLDEAVSRGILTNEQTRAMAELLQEDKSDSEERFKPVGTMNELFVTLGVILLLSAVGGIVTQLLKQPTAALLVNVAFAWLVAMYFHQRKRFRLPIIVCCLNAAIGVGVATRLALGGSGNGFFDTNVPLMVALLPLVVALAALVAGAWRFRLPVMMLPISILFTVIVTHAAQYGDQDISYRLLLGGSGLAILGVAIRFDLQDPHRVTRMSDFAFWSYVVGSPLFVHSLFLTLLLDGEKEWLLSPGAWVAMVALAACVSFVGVLLNRRALIISTLVYVGFIIFRLLSELPVGGHVWALLGTLLVIGLYVTCLGSRWTQVRSWLMRRLPPWKWLARLPPYRT